MQYFFATENRAFLVKKVYKHEKKNSINIEIDRISSAFFFCSFYQEII